ncbi:hypothetical protein Tco_0984349, partial [Tanacetum coccineum]
DAYEKKLIQVLKIHTDDNVVDLLTKALDVSSDEEMARKVQEEWEGEEERKRLAEEEATNEALIRN